MTFGTINNVICPVSLSGAGRLPTPKEVASDWCVLMVGVVSISTMIGGWGGLPDAAECLHTAYAFMLMA